MPLTMPDFIARAGVADEPLRHRWDDDNPFAFYREDPRLGNRIERTSWRGVIALSLGCAEWVAWRLHRHCPDPVLPQRIEAVWAGLIDWRYLRPAERLPRAQWSGPVGGPIREAYGLLNTAVELVQHEQFAWPEAVGLSYLVEYVAPDPAGFRRWRRDTVSRLAAYYPSDSDDPLGAPVPRAALDPDLDFRPDQAGELLARYVRELRPAGNPFLQPAEEMLAAGFPGTPYGATR